jgi:hypothetical protein
MSALAAITCLTGLGLVSATSAASGSAAVPMKASAKTAAAPGSGLGAIQVTATSAAMKVPLYEHQGEDVQASIPYSTSTLGSGGTGSSSTSVFWPGSTGANAGSALQLLGITQIPASVEQMLNDPEIATAQTGVGNKTVSLSHPGLTMSATATPTHVHSESAAGGSGVQLIGPVIGNTDATTNISVTGPKKVVVTSTNTIHHVNIDKMISIDSLTTRLRAVTNGHTSHGTQRTIIGGMSVAGIPVTIDSKGLHVADKGPVATPLAPVTTLLGTVLPTTTITTTAVSAVNTALKAAGISMSLTPASMKSHKGHIKMVSRALVLKLSNTSYTGQANSTGTLLVLGAASIDALATPGFPAGSLPPASSPPSSGGGTPAGTTTTTGGSTGSVGTAGTPGTPAIPGTPATVSTAPAVAGAPSSSAPEKTQLTAASPLPLPSGLNPAWIVVALAVAGLGAFGLKRLPDKLLSAAGPNCHLEE